MMPLQRACDAENQVRNKLSNGPLRAQSNVKIIAGVTSRPEDGIIEFGPEVNANHFYRVFCDVGGRRYLPGICLYPAKRTAVICRESRWHRGLCRTIFMYVIRP